MLARSTKRVRVITIGSVNANGVRSGGNGTGGLHTYNDGETGRAHTTNRGTITTYGEPDHPSRWRNTLRAQGVEATSQKNSAHGGEYTGTVHDLGAWR